MASVINTSSDSGVLEVCTSGQPRDNESVSTVDEGELFLCLKISYCFLLTRFSFKRFK